MKFLRVFASLYLLHQTFATPTQTPTQTPTPTPTKATAADMYEISDLCTTPTSVLGEYQAPVYSSGLFPAFDGPPRIQALCPALVADEEIHFLLNKVPNHLMGTLAYAPAFMPGLYDLFRGVINSDKRTLPLHDAVIVILRTAWKLKCEYIFKQKNPDYLRGGYSRLTDLVGTADFIVKTAKEIAAGDGPFDLRQRALIKMVDEQVDDNKTNSNSTMAELKSKDVKEGQIVEALIMHGLIGTYCSVLKGLRVEIDPDYSVANMVDTRVKLLPEDRRTGFTI